MPEIIDCKTARAMGLKRYFTGNPCCHGHVAERSVNGGCLACSKEAMRLRRADDPEKERERSRECARRNYANNQEKLRERARRYYADNREKRMEYDRLYRAANQDKRREKDRLYREGNRDKYRERKRCYREANREKIQEYSRARDLKLIIALKALKELGITIPEMSNVTR